MDGETYDGPVEVFYLTVEHHRGGYRCFGKASPVLTSNEAFSSEVEARKAGRPSLIAASARAKPTRRTKRLEPSCLLD